MDYRFKKSEKLKSKKEIDLLFNTGKSISAYPLKLIYTQTETPIKVGVSVSKKKFKKAVDRNRVKRLLREAYRLNKNEFINNNTLNHSFMILYISKEMPRFNSLNLKMKQLLSTFNSKITN